MPADPAARTFSDLTPTEFENFAFDVLSAAGVRNLTWRTPGADGGRDIEGTVYATDFSGSSHEQVWYFECKRYSSSLDWPLVYGKLAYADTHGADYLLIITNSSPSPNCETQIALWNKGRRKPFVRVWRGYELNGLADRFPVVAAKYGLSIAPPPKIREFLDLAVEISKITQVSYAAITVDSKADSAIECAAALSELFSLRCEDMASYGRFMRIGKEITNEKYVWIEGTSNRLTYDTATRAVVASIRYALGARALRISEEGGEFKLTPIEARIPLRPSAEHLLSVVGVWADMEVVPAADGDIIVRGRES
jgi:Restriction endonuclease